MATPVNGPVRLSESRYLVDRNGGVIAMTTIVDAEGTTLAYCPDSRIASALVAAINAALLQ